MATTCWATGKRGGHDHQGDADVGGCDMRGTGGHMDSGFVVLRIGTRVLAVRDCTDGVLHVYGRGTFAGYERPPGDWPEDYTNPKIELECGSVVWGNQCWWGSLEQWENKYGGMEWLDVPLPGAKEVEAT